VEGCGCLSPCQLNPLEPTSLHSSASFKCEREANESFERSKHPLVRGPACEHLRAGARALIHIYMGNKTGRGPEQRAVPSRAASRDSVSTSPTLADFRGQRVSAILDGEDQVQKRKFKAALKAKSLEHCVDFLEAVEKRLAVFSSGQRIGDSLEKGQEQLYSSGQTILERFGPKASQPVPLSDAVKHALVTVDLSEKDAFFCCCD